jgi:alkaline phosphatase D
MRCFVLIAALTSGLLLMPVAKTITTTAAALPPERSPAQSLAEYPAQLLSGPMVGPATSTSASVWLETDRPAEVAVHYWVEHGSDPLVRGTATVRTNAEAPHVGVAALEPLPERGLVHYELAIDGRTVRPQTPQAFQLPPAPNASSSFSVAFASCTNPIRVPVQPIWTQIGVYRPDVLLLIGDNNYMPMQAGAYEAPDSTMRYAMARYHRFLRDLPGLRSVIATTPTYAIWDDHDFGPNNADRTFARRDMSLDLFKRYWPNPGAGTPETPGVFYSFQIGDAEFFMLDDRYHRDPNESPTRSTMLGAGQLTWLKNALSASEARFKVIVGGHTLTIDRGDNQEYWARFGSERDDFLRWMFGEDIGGVFFLSGDWHVGSLSRIEFPEDGYPLYELISSNAGVSSVEADDHQHSYHRQTTGHSRRFEGPIISDIRDYNFGLLDFSGEGEDRSVLLRLIDHRGEVRVAHRLVPADLQAPSSEDGQRTSLEAGDVEFIPLFDGETLDGWVVENTDAGNFSVQNGILRVDGPGGWLRSEETYSNFDLRVEFRFLTDDADSGVFVRASDTSSTFARGWPSGSYQVQTRDITSNLSDRPLLLGDIYRHGMPDGETDYDADAAQEVFREIGEWQEFEITVAGDSLLVHLNGVPITRARGLANPSGYLGIQGETDTVEFRAIEIQEH